MEVTIPKTFQLLGREYKVKQENRVTVDGESVCGYCMSTDGIIKIRKNLKKDLKEHTFLHEITHAILDSLGHTELSANEGFVDSFSGALYQVLKTAK